jgi:hypothetical protein
VNEKPTPAQRVNADASRVAGDRRHEETDTIEILLGIRSLT